MGALQVWIIDVADLVFADPPEAFLPPATAALLAFCTLAASL